MIRSMLIIHKLECGGVQVSLAVNNMGWYGALTVWCSICSELFHAGLAGVRLAKSGLLQVVSI